MMWDKSAFGELVKAYRKQRGWTQAELAERWGHSRGYVTQIERGQRKLDSTSQLVRLADILDIPTEDQGIKLSLNGMRLASEYKSKRHILWLEKTYQRLRILPIGQDKRLNILREALMDAQKKQAV